MLLSQKHNFLFIHIYKNAGTSITQAFYPYTIPVWQRTLLRVLKKTGFRPGWDPQPFPDHISAPELLDALGHETYYSLFSFAIVRNPWDWQVSLYNFMLQDKNHYQRDLVKGLGSFETYIRWRCANEVRLQKDFIYSEDGERLVNFVGRFERLEKDFQIICSKIGIEATLPRLNVSNRGKTYQAYYSDVTRYLVEKTFAPDIQLFDYHF